MKHAISFKVRPFKDQTITANKGLPIQVGDTVTVVRHNGAAAASTQDLVVTEIVHGGLGFGWDAGLTQNLRPEDIIRLHAKHLYACPGALNYRVILTELNPTTVQASVTSMAFGSPTATYGIGVTEAAAAGNGIAAEFGTRLAAAINAVLGREGNASVVIAGTAGTQTVTITITSLTLLPGNLVVAGLTAGAWAVI